MRSSCHWFQLFGIKQQLLVFDFGIGYLYCKPVSEVQRLGCVQAVAGHDQVTHTIEKPPMIFSNSAGTFDWTDADACTFDRHLIAERCSREEW